MALPGLGKLVAQEEFERVRFVRRRSSVIVVEVAAHFERIELRVGDAHGQAPYAASAPPAMSAHPVPRFAVTRYRWSDDIGCRV